MLGLGLPQPALGIGMCAPVSPALPSVMVASLPLGVSMLASVAGVPPVPPLTPPVALPPVPWLVLPPLPLPVVPPLPLLPPLPIAPPLPVELPAGDELQAAAATRTKHKLILLLTFRIASPDAAGGQSSHQASIFREGVLHSSRPVPAQSINRDPDSHRCELRC
jgi:hypothetical protein